MWDKNIETEWDVPDFLGILGDEYSKEFAMAEFSPSKRTSPFSSGEARSLGNYQKRIQALSFVNKKLVLDAGCGMGQWSYVLSSSNERIIGVDQSDHRLEIARYVNRNKKNVEFFKCNLENISAESGSFDAIFCYGVFMFTDMVKTLLEFKRVLHKEGVIFLNFNNIGHYVHRILYHTTEVKNEELVLQFKNMISNYYRGVYKSSLMTLETLQKLLEQMGLEIVYSGYDGESACLPFYKTEFYNFPYVTEVLIKNKE